jgi:ABC-type transport system substrate-binding protein
VACALGCTNNPYPPGESDKKILYQNFSDPPKTLDPAVAYTTTEHMITGKVHDTLLEYHYLKRPYELIPGLAVGVPEPTHHGDGTVSYLFELRPGLLYQNDPCFSLSGALTRKILASDVAFELERIADPSVNSPVVEPFSNVLGFREFSAKLMELRKQRGFSELPVHEQYQRAGGIAGVKVRDDQKLELVLATPYPQILYWFAMPFTTPVPWEAVAYYHGKGDRPPLADRPVASGPFVLAEYDKQARMTLERNPNWYGVRHPEWKAPGATYPSEGTPEDHALGRLSEASVGKPLPFLDEIQYRRDKESIPAFNKFLQGYYDVSGIIRESFDKVIHEGRLSDEMRALGMKLD